MIDTHYPYSTSDPETVATYHRVLTELGEFGERTRAACEAVGGNKGPLVNRGMWGRPDEIVALEPDGSGEIPDGWRMVRGRLEPRRGKAGDGARQWLAAHQPPDLRHALVAHGLPRHATVPGGDGLRLRLVAPVLFEMDGTLWAGYAGKPGDSFLDKGDACTWTPRKLSEFYTALGERKRREDVEAVSRP